MRKFGTLTLRGDANTPWNIAISVLMVTILLPAKITVQGAPAKFDSNETPFPLELQPPQYSDDLNTKSAVIDSYGNPIDTLKPIETPDGRKVVSAQGLQFEIPNYASGITEIQKPSDDLLPPFIVPFKSPDEETEVAAATNQQTTTEKPNQNRNPFLATRDDGAYHPKPFSKNSGSYTTTTTTTTTSTTSTTPAPAVEENPFDSATIPTWLKDFDYPDLGPGVPFTYYPEDNDSDVNKDLVPPVNFDARQATEGSKPAAVFVSTSPVSFNSFNIPQNIPQSTSDASSSSVDSTISSPSITSKVTIPLPPTSITNSNDLSTLPQPNVVFVPPTTDVDTIPTNDNDNRQSGTAVVAADNVNPNDVQLQLSTPSFNPNFAAPFDTDDSQQTQSTSAFDPSSFPPSQGGNNVAVKTTFTKSDEGKVITNNVPFNPFLTGVQQSPKPFGFSAGAGNQQKDFGLPDSNQFDASSSIAGQSPSTNTFSPAASGFSKAPFTGFSVAPARTESSSNLGGKYTGGFGGAQGILGNGKIGTAVQTGDSGNSAAPKIVPTAAPRPVPTQSNYNGFGNRNSGPTNNYKYTGKFGGPPGVLVPIGQNH